MAGITVGCGLLLILLGVGAFVYAGATTAVITALIPAAIGLVLLILGCLSFKDSLRKHTMHAAAGLASLTFMACIIQAAPGLYVYYKDGIVIKTDHNGNKRDATLAVQCQAATAGITLVFVGLCVNSFIQARRNRAKTETAKPTL